MATPGIAWVIAKIGWPETEESPTNGAVKLEVKKLHANLARYVIPAWCLDGLRISLKCYSQVPWFYSACCIV